jgi:hypothetical protein
MKYMMAHTPAPQRAACSTRTSFNHGPEESKYSSSPLGSSPTHSFPFRRSPFRNSGNRTAGVCGPREHPVHMQNKYPDPDGQRVNTLSIGEIGGCGAERFMQLLHRQTPNAEIPI